MAAPATQDVISQSRYQDQLRRAGHTTRYGARPLQHHQSADVVGKVLQADFSFGRAGLADRLMPPRAIGCLR